jgi:alanine-synthesizing transaminase
VRKPKATMFVWARIPAQYQSMGSLEFSKKLLSDARVAVSPGIGFGNYGDDHVRFSLIENEHRTRQAVRGIKQMFREDARAAGFGSVDTRPTAETGAEPAESQPA